MARALRATEVRVPCRIAFAHLINVDAKGFYSCALLIPKTDTKTLIAINKAVDAAINDGKAKLGNKDGFVNKKMLKLPLRDADEEDVTHNGYKHMMFLNAKNKRRPQCVNRRLEPIDDESELYGGCYCNVLVNFYAFVAEGKKGIAASLGNVQKIKDGESFGHSRTTADEDFDELDDEEDLF